MMPLKKSEVRDRHWTANEKENRREYSETASAQVRERGEGSIISNHTVL